MYQHLGASPKFSLQHLPAETAQMVLSHLSSLATGSAFSSLFVKSGPVAGVPTSPSFSLYCWSITNYRCIYTWWGPYHFHGGWPQLCFPSRECPRCATQLAVMPLEPLIIVVDLSASFATLVFKDFRGDVSYTNKPFKDCWYPLLSLPCQLRQGTMVWLSVCTTEYLEQ